MFELWPFHNRPRSFLDKNVMLQIRYEQFFLSMLFLRVLGCAEKMHFERSFCVSTVVFRDVWVHCKTKLQCMDVVFKFRLIYVQILFTFYNSIC